MQHHCTFPKLPDKFDRALREAVSFVLERFKPVGIIAAGTIVRGMPDATSDLDVWVRQMLHFAFLRCLHPQLNYWIAR